MSDLKELERLFEIEPDIQELLDARLRYLEEESASYRMATRLSSTLPIAAMVTGFANGLNPICQMGIGLGFSLMTAYWLADSARCGKWRPYPLSRSSWIAPFNSFSNLKTGQNIEGYEANPDYHDVISCLIAEQAVEFTLLMDYRDELINLLTPFQKPSERFRAYRNTIWRTKDGRNPFGVKLKPEPEAQPQTVTQAVKPQTQPEEILVELPTLTSAIAKQEEVSTQIRVELPTPEEEDLLGEVEEKLFGEEFSVQPSTPNLELDFEGELEAEFELDDAALPLYSLPTPVEVEEKPPFPVEDVAQVMAEVAVDISLPGSTFIACPPGTGKSNLVRAAMHKLFVLQKGNVDFQIYAGKEGEAYCGLEQSPAHYLDSGDSEQTVLVEERLETLRPRLKALHSYPTVLVCDEYNNTLTAAKMYDSDNTATKGEGKIKYFTRIPLRMYQVITKGRSKNVSAWITSHQPDVTVNQIPVSLQNSLNFVVNGRGSFDGAITAILTNKRQVIDDERVRGRLLNQYMEYKEKLEREGKHEDGIVICLTNLRGPWRLVVLPRYPDEQPPIWVPPVRTEQQQAKPVAATHDDLPPHSLVQRLQAETGNLSSPNNGSDVQQVEGRVAVLDKPLAVQEFEDDIDQEKIKAALERKLARLKASNEKVYAGEFTADEARSLIAIMRSKEPGLTRTQIIETFWECTAGGSKKWDKANAEYDELFGKVKS